MGSNPHTRAACATRPRRGRTSPLPAPRPRRHRPAARKPPATALSAGATPATPSLASREPAPSPPCWADSCARQSASNRLGQGDPPPATSGQGSKLSSRVGDHHPDASDATNRPTAGAASAPCGSRVASSERAERIKRSSRVPNGSRAPLPRLVRSPARCGGHSWPALGARREMEHGGVAAEAEPGIRRSAAAAAAAAAPGRPRPGRRHMLGRSPPRTAGIPLVGARRTRSGAPV